MINWRHKIKIRDISEDPYFDPEKDKHKIPAYGKLMAERLKTYPFLNNTPFAAQFEKSKTLAQFNLFLDRLYDYCDEHKIWVEL